MESPLHRSGTLIEHPDFPWFLLQPGLIIRGEGGFTITETLQPLVGRESELALLTRLVAETEAGAPRFAQVTGEPGIGKTYLLEELGRRADERGWLVLGGRCSELERVLPFGLVIDAFDAYLGSLDPVDFLAASPKDEMERASRALSVVAKLSPPIGESRNPRRNDFERICAVVGDDGAARSHVSRCCCSLTICIGPTEPRSSRPATSCAGRLKAAVMIVGSFRVRPSGPDADGAVEAAARGGAVRVHGSSARSVVDDAAQLIGRTSAT